MASNIVLRFILRVRYFQCNPFVGHKTPVHPRLSEKKMKISRWPPPARILRAIAGSNLCFKFYSQTRDNEKLKIKWFHFFFDSVSRQRYAIKSFVFPLCIFRYYYLFFFHLFKTTLRTEPIARNRDLFRRWGYTSWMQMYMRNSYFVQRIILSAGR